MTSATLSPEGSAESLELRVQRNNHSACAGKGNLKPSVGSGDFFDFDRLPGPSLGDLRAAKSDARFAFDRRSQQTNRGSCPKRGGGIAFQHQSGVRRAFFIDTSQNDMIPIRPGSIGLDVSIRLFHATS